MNKNKNEILAPAGSIEALYAGINAGADAVYIGGDMFGARAYADNPVQEDLLKAIDYVHLHNKKIYLTVNTLLKNQEIENKLFEYILPYYAEGLDAVIVQDLGVFSFVRQNFPDLDIHASTQMAITGINGARLLKDMGATRIVTARELSLNELSDIHKNVDIEIESFVHGAMCYCYSGQCLFSSILGGRSGNRGRCAGPCRQPYSVRQNGSLVNDENSKYVLSLRDMNTLNIIPQIIEAGVYSMKIEGRMKSPEYVSGTVSMYKKYVDLYYSLLEKNKSTSYKVSALDIDKLSSLYSRSGSTTGYYECHNDKKMISINKPSYETCNENYINELKSMYSTQITPIKCNAKVSLHVNSPAEIIVYSCKNQNIKASYSGAVVSAALKRPMDKETIIEKINKTGGSYYTFDNITIDSDNDIFMPVSQINDLRRNVLDRMTNNLLHSFKRGLTEKTSYNENNKSYTDKATHNENNKSYPDKATHNENNKSNSDKTCVLTCYVNTKEQLESAISHKEISKIYLSTDFFSTEEYIVNINKIKAKGIEPVIVMPYIFRNTGIQYFKRLHELTDLSDYYFLVRNIDELGYLNSIGHKFIISDYLLYAFNSHSINTLMTNGVSIITQPFELNSKELRHNNTTESEFIIYGRIPLMISAGCLNNTINSCDKKTKKIYISDRLDAEFPVLNMCNFCYNIIYNNNALSFLELSDKILNMHFKSLRISLSDESFEESEEILEKYISSFINHDKLSEISNYTRGHFNRGVE